MTLEEIRKKYGINTTDKKTTQSEENSTGGKMTLDEIRKKYGLSSGVDQDYINSFVADTEKYSSADMADSYRVWNELGLGKRAGAIRGWLDKNKTKYTDQNAYKQFSDAIDSYLNIGKEYSSFADEKAYGDWYKSYQDNLAKDEEMRNTDLEAGRKHINNLENDLNGIKVTKQRIADLQNENKILELARLKGNRDAAAKIESNNKTIANYQAALDEAYGKYGSQEGLEGYISQKRAYYTLAERAQNAAELASVADVNSENYDPKFDEYSTLGNHISWENVGDKTNKDGIAIYDDVKAAALVMNERWLGQELYTEDMVKPKSGIAGYFEGLKRLSEYNTENTEKINIFRKMSNDELKTFAYYLKKDEETGSNLAEEYIDSIKEGLNEKRGKDIAASKETEFSKYLFGVEAGLDQFFEGRDALFSDADYIPTSPTQYASGMVREDLADRGVPWFNAKTGEWEDWDVNVFGSSWGQMNYDAITTTSNMLPSILASTAVSAINPVAGSVVGSTLLGTSAGGNAKAEMLNLGYSKGQATAYGIMVAIAEGSMEYFLGHIPGLSKGDGIFSTLAGKALSKVDNALARVAITIGGSLDEALEEGLQAIIEPWIKEVATNVDWDDPSVDEVLYSSLLGAISSLGLGGGNAAINAGINTVQQNQAYKSHGQSIIDKGGVVPLKSLSYEVAKSMEGKDGKEINRLASRVEKKATPKNVGKLSAKLEGKITKQNRAAYESALEKNGLSKKEAKLATDYLLDSEDLSYADKYTIENDERFQKAIDAVSVDPDLGVSNGIAELYAAREGKKLNEVLNSVKKSDTINESEANTDEGEGIHLRDSGERNDGQNTEESVFDLESSTGKNQSWRKAGQFADGEAARLVNEGREVSTADLGVLRGSDKHTVRLVDEGNETPTMKQAKARASERGLNIKFFVGDNLVIADSDGKLFAARGYILGNTMLVRADHPYYTADQITRHEIGHDMIAKGEVNAKDVQNRLKKVVGEENVEAIADRYATAYEGTNLTPEEIWEECICDSLGDMNIFAGDEIVSKFMAPAMTEVKSATESTAKSPTQTRGSPEGKASRVVKQDYFSYQALGIRVVSHIRQELQKLYSDVADGIANGVAVEYGNKVYITDSSKENGNVRFGVRKDAIYIMSDATHRANFVRRTNYDSCGKGDVSDGLFAKIGYGNVNRGKSGGRRPLGKKLSANNGTPQYNQKRVSENNADQGVSKQRAKQRTDDGINELLEQLKAQLDSGAEPYIADGYNQADKKMLGQLKALLDKGTQGKASRELDTEYLSAVNRGDMETAQKMVDEAAKEAGYTVKGMHATNAEFTVFDINKTSSVNFHGKGIYFTNSVRDVENNYENYEGPDPWQKIEGRAYELVYDKYGISYEDTLTNDPEIIDKLNECYDIAIDEFKKSGRRITAYLRFDNPLILEKGMQIPNNYAGYDGIVDKQVYENIGHSGMDENTIHYVVFNPNNIKSADPITYDDNGDVIPLSERFNPKNSDIRYSRELDTIDYIDEQAEREGTERVGVEPLSNREILANALESIAQNEIEQNKLKEYKDNISKMNAQSAKLAELKKEIKELTFGKGKKNPEKLKALKAEATKTENRINLYDKKLLSLETASVLKDVLEREKRKAYSRAAQKGREAMHRNVEGRHKTEMRHKIKNIVSELNALLLKPTSKKHIKEELRKGVAEALDAFNMDTVGAEERLAEINKKLQTTSDPYEIEHLLESYNRISRQGEKLADRLNALHQAYAKIKNSEDIELNLAYQEVIYNSIEAVSEKVGNTSIRNMTLEQLEMVYDLFKMIQQTIRNANKAFKTQKGETIMQIAEAVNDQVRTVGGQPYKHNVISSWLQKEGWHLLKPYVAFRTIGSETLTNLYKELRNGEDTFYNDVKEATAFIEEQYEKHGYKSWDMKKTETFTAKSGKSFDLTLEQMMTLYAYSKREQALDHIIQGGIVLEDAVIVEKNKLGIPMKYEVTTKDAFNLSEETFSEIANSLTDEQKAFVDEMQRYLSITMGAKGNEVSMELLGVKLFKEEFYLPIKSSQYYMNFKAEEAGEVKLKSPAFSKETVQHANNPIVLHNFTDLWAEHINDMSMYHSFVLALEDFTRVYNYKTKTDDKAETMDTKATLETAYPGVKNYINKFLKDLNGGVRSETVGWAEKLTSLAKKGAVLGSASVAIQQPSAIMRAMAYVNPKYFVVTAPESINLAKHKQEWGELKKYAPIAGIKEMGRFDVGMGKGTVDLIKSNETAMGKVEDLLGKAPELMDEITWVSIWNAVKRETVHNHKDLRPGSEEFLKVAGERFTEVVSLSQVYDSVFSRSDLMRNKSLVAKWLTAFMAEPTTTLNMLWDAYIQGKRTGSKMGFIKTTAPVVSSIVAATVLNALLKSIVMAARDDDEDESYAEKYLEHFFGDLKDNLNPLALIPVVKDVLSIFNGYNVERMDMSLVSDLKKAIDAFNSDSKTTYEKWSGLVGAISAFFGVPVKNVERDIRAVINTFFGKTEATTKAGLIDAIEGGWTGKSKSNGQQLYEAMLSGDAEHIERVEGRFKDQSAIDTAIRKTIGEKYKSGEISRTKATSMLTRYGDYDENEAYWKLKEWDYKKRYGDDAEWSKYSEFYTAVKTGKNLKAVIKDYTDHGVSKESLASQITSYYKPLYKKMSKAQRANIKGYLLNAYQLLGYKRADKSKDIDKWLED